MMLLVGILHTTEGNKKMFCYYSSFAQTRPGIGKFLPEDIDPFMCTHVIFAFVDISSDGKDLISFNWNDKGENGLYSRTLALKKRNPDLKILLAVGGWMIGSKPFIPMIRSESKRKTWVKNVVSYLRRHKFDGFDMDWEFPATRGSPPEDKYRFTKLMKTLYDAFAEEAQQSGRQKLILTLATASGTYYINQSYETKEIIKYIDYMLLMTYNYHGQWEKVTGHHGAMWKHQNDPPGEKSELYTEWSIDYWLNIGIPKSKLIVGIPTYGMSFTLASPHQHGLFAPVRAGGRMGKYTSETGILSHYEVCENIQKRGWKTEWIDQQGVPYAYGGDQWVGYENIDSIKIKAKNILKRNLAGAFIWSLEMDDFSGSCGEGKSPLISTVRDILKPYSSRGSISEWGLKSGIAEVDVTTSSIERNRNNRRPTWKPKPSYKPRPTWKSRISNSEEKKKPTFSANPKPAWKSKPTRRPRPTWARPTSVPKIEKKSTNMNKTPMTRPKPTYRPIRKQHSAAGSVDCAKLGMGIFPDPSSCEHFILCLPGGQVTYRPIRMACPEGTRFDRDLSICNHAKEIQC